MAGCEMGCDIHGVVQIKYSGESDWQIEESAGFDDSRNYLVFSILAGVRNRTELSPISEPRGIPEDFVYPEEGYLSLGDHSFSWLALPEILAWAGWNDPLKYGELGFASHIEAAGTFYQWLKWLESRFTYCQVRLVFGFDS